MMLHKKNMPTTEVKLSQKTYEQSNNIIRNKLQRIGTTQVEKKFQTKDYEM